MAARSFSDPQQSSEQASQIDGRRRLKTRKERQNLSDKLFAHWRQIDRITRGSETWLLLGAGAVELGENRETLLQLAEDASSGIVVSYDFPPYRRYALSSIRKAKLILRDRRQRRRAAARKHKCAAKTRRHKANVRPKPVKNGFTLVAADLGVARCRVYHWWLGGLIDGTCQDDGAVVIEQASINRARSALAKARGNAQGATGSYRHPQSDGRGHTTSGLSPRIKGDEHHAGCEDPFARQ